MSTAIPKYPRIAAPVSNAAVHAEIAASRIEPRAPGFRDMAPPIVIGPVVSAIVFFAATRNPAVVVVAVVAAVVTVMLVGWPIIFWLVDNGRGRVARTLAGALCGAAPFMGALLAGVAGLYIKSNDLEYVQWALGHGASVPYYGLVLWPRFAFLAVLGLVAGVATFWTATLFQPRPPAHNL